jgi:hypothetical protein
VNIICEHCGAPYKGTVAPHQKTVKCQHCGCAIKVDDGLTGREKLLIKEVVVETSRAFSIEDFAGFLFKRGIKTFDPGSGILQFGSQQACVSEEGIVEGPEPLKLRVEKWIEMFLMGS